MADSNKKKTPAICHDERKCFARIYGRCVILTSTYAPGECPFCKPNGGNHDANFAKYDGRAI